MMQRQLGTVNGTGPGTCTSTPPSISGMLMDSAVGTAVCLSLYYLSHHDTVSFIVCVPYSFFSRQVHIFDVESVVLY